MKNTKIVLISLWILLLATFFIDSSWARFGKYLFFALFIVHVLEFFVFFGRFRKIGGNMFNHFVNTVIYGMIHIQAEERKKNGN